MQRERISRNFALALAVLPIAAFAGCSSLGWPGSSPASCNVPQLAGTVVHVDLSDSGGMGGGGMSGPGGGTSGAPGGHMMAMTLRSDNLSVPGDQPVSFVAHNSGTELHELVVVQLAAGSQARSLPIGGDQKADESASRAEASKPCAGGAGQGLSAGETGWVTVNLPAGAYALICNEPGHYAAGMWTDFVVR